MKRFARLFAELDATTSTNAKVDALQALLRRGRAARRRLGGVLPRRRQAAPGGAERRAVGARLRSRAGIADWLFDECYQAVGDLAETIAHVLPPPAHESDLGLAEWVEERLLPLRGLAPEEQARARHVVLGRARQRRAASCSPS